jgi:octaprenyl-diphosphate synthase
MAEVDAVISRRLDSGVPLVGQVSRYIISAGGKRLRPALLLLVAGALGYAGEQRFNLAAVVEFIHTATLLHDDVVDESTLRRGRATANESFGNPASVLVGDFLYSRAFQMMLDAHDMRVMEILADATNVIAEGEVMQLVNMHDPNLDEAGYVQVIRSKTAKLFEASARLAAVLAKAPADVERACADYGQALGTAFQVIDDVLDYDGDVAVMGKRRPARRQGDPAAHCGHAPRHGRAEGPHQPRDRARRPGRPRPHRRDRARDGLAGSGPRQCGGGGAARDRRRAKAAGE